MRVMNRAVNSGLMVGNGIGMPSSLAVLIAIVRHGHVRARVRPLSVPQGIARGHSRDRGEVVVGRRRRDATIRATGRPTGCGRPRRPSCGYGRSSRRRGAWRSRAGSAPYDDIRLNVSQPWPASYGRCGAACRARPEKCIGKKVRFIADEGEPEMPVAELLAHQASGDLREVVVDAGKDAHHRAAEQHVVEVGDDEVACRSAAGRPAATRA